MNAPKPVKHLRRREATEPPGTITRYYAACSASGTASRDFPQDLDKVTCPKCVALVPRSKLHAKKG